MDNKCCPECHSRNTYPDGCCGKVGCAECGWEGYSGDLKCPGELIDGAEIMRGEER